MFFDAFKLLTDESYRGDVFKLLAERFIPTAIGVTVTLIGVAFIISGTSAGKAAGSVVELLATKGGSIAKAVK